MQLRVREYLGHLLVARSFDFLQRSFHLEEDSGQFQFVLFEVKVGKQVDRSPLGDRTDLDHSVSKKPGKEMLEPLAPTQQLLQTIGEVPQRSSYVAPRRRPVDEARHVERFGLGQTERLNDVNIPF